MQNLPEGVHDREGCFVFQVVEENGLEVRSQLNVGDESRTGTSFQVGELVSVDLVRHSRVPGSKNGPFLRLTDCSGWLFEKKDGHRCMREVPVESGLWCFYVDNAPVGQALRHHPVDRSSKKVKSVVYQPIQKIYCDRKVRHPDSGVSFYRVQGTGGWVFDTRPASAGDVGYMLLDESMVETGLFVYQAVVNLAVRSAPNTGDEFRTSHRTVSEGELVAVDAIRKSPYGKLNGPFLRSNDGSGWLFEKKGGERMMLPIRVEAGSWKLQVVNPVGIRVRRQPIDSKKLCANLTFSKDQIVCCDRMVQSQTGVKFYRMENTKNGWVFDKRGDHDMMTLQSTNASAEIVSFSSSTSWSPDFVRGLAASVEGLNEIAFKPASRLISFQTADGARINVYYSTRTVGTAINHPTQGKTQLFRRHCSPTELLDIFKNPRLHTGRGYKRRRFSPDHVVSTTYGSGILLEDEEETRNAILEYDRELNELLEKRKELLSTVRDMDLKRAKEAATARELADKRRHELEEAERKAREEAEREERKRQELRDRTCSDCGRVFPNAHARAQHHRDVHQYKCDYCGRVFRSWDSLNQHCNAVDHW